MPENEAFNSLWADALAEYEKQTDRRIESNESFQELKNLRDLEDAIEADRERFGAFRGEHRRIYSALKKCIAPMEPMLDIVQKGIGNTPYAPASAVFGAASYLLQACAGVSKAYDGVEELFRQMSDITVRLKEYDSKSIESSLSKKLTDILAFVLTIMGQAEAAIERKRFRQWAKTVFLKDDAISSSVAKLQKYVEAELGLVIALTYGRVKDVQEIAVDTQSDVKSVKAGLSDILMNQRSDRQRAFSEADEKMLYDALRTKSFEEIAREHAGNCEKLTKDTATWLRDDALFQAWEEEKAPCLWIFGKPGVGKTMLAARTIETLQNEYPQHADIPSLTSVSYLYFKDGNPELQDCAQMWKSAALQITKANDRFKKHVLATIEKKQETFASARRIWQQLFLEFFLEDVSSRFPTSLAFIIIDGLDEAPQAERVELLACLAELINRGPTSRKCRIQVAVFARPAIRADPGFEKIGYRIRESLIEVTPERSALDIDLYIKQRLADVSVLQVLRRRKATKEFQTLAKQIYNSVQSKCQGMFLWARLVFDQIRASPSPEAINRSLQGAPEGLDEMLHHVFKRLEIGEEMHQSYLKFLITLVFCAHRPLDVSELFILIMISLGQHCYMLEDDLGARYSSLFDVTGPNVESRGDQAQVGTNEDETSSDDPDFGFLDNDDIVPDEEAKKGPEPSNCNANVFHLQKEVTVVTNHQEEEDMFNMPPHWCKSTVTFSHARIRDYLETEGDPSTRRWHDSSIVPDDLNQDQLTIVLACLRVIKTNIADTYNVKYLRNFALSWVEHLAKIDFSKIPKGAAIQLARQLSTLFHSGHALLQMYLGAHFHFLATWLISNRCSTLVQRIMRDYTEDVDEDQRKWVLSAAKSKRLLFQPLMITCARTWLTEEGWDDSVYFSNSKSVFIMLYGCNLLTDDGIRLGPVDFFRYHSYFDYFPLETLESLANSAQVPKSAHYYASLAWIMMEAQKETWTDQAIVHFKKALDLLPGGWIAMEGLARCYGEKRKEYDTAIYWMENAIHNLPRKNASSRVRDMKITLCFWKAQLGNDQEFTEIAKSCYEASIDFIYGDGSANDLNTTRSIKLYIEALHRTGQYDNMTELLYDLDTKESAEPYTSMWTMFLRNQCWGPFGFRFNELGKIIIESKNDSLQQFMREFIKKANIINADNIGEAGPIWLATTIAQWQYNYAPDPQESIELCEKIIDLVDQSNKKVQQEQNWYRMGAACYLSLICFNIATEKFNSGKDTSVEIAKLEDLAQYKQVIKRYYRASYPATLLGLWLHEFVRAGDEGWRAYIRPTVKQALHLLSDNDPGNPREAYNALGQGLFAAGDVLNGSIAFGVNLRELRDYQIELKRRESEQNVHNDLFSHKQATPYAMQAVRQQNEQIDRNISNQQTPDTDARRSFGNDIDEPEGSIKHSAREMDDTDGEHAAALDDNKYNGNDHLNIEYSGSGNDDEKDRKAKSFPKHGDFVSERVCDGPCDTPKSDYVELWHCRVCQDCDLCEKCIELHRNDEIPGRFCSVDHPFVRIYPLIDEAREITDALVEKRFEAQQKWLDGLWKVWGD